MKKRLKQMFVNYFVLTGYERYKKNRKIIYSGECKTFVFNDKEKIYEKVVCRGIYF